MNYASLITQSAQELLTLEKQQSKAKLKDRLRFLRFLKEGTAKTQQQAGHLVGLKQRQSHNLWRTYRQGGLEGLLTYNNHGTLGYLSFTQISQLRHFVDTDQAATLAQIQTFLADRFGIKYSIGGLGSLCQRLKIKAKTGRPTNVRRDEAGAQVFKKTSIST